MSEVQELLDWIVRHVHAFHGIKYLDGEWSLRFTLRYGVDHDTKRGWQYSNHAFSSKYLLRACEEACEFLLGKMFP